MKPYYERDGITIYYGDCREILPHVDADVLVTDPPYGIAFKSGWTGAAIAGDECTGVREAVRLLWGGARPALIFGAAGEAKPAGGRCGSRVASARVRDGRPRFSVEAGLRADPRVR